MATDYATGDYQAVADRLRPAAEHLVGMCAVGSGEVVVDVAAGSGNVSRLCTQRGATAIAVDREPAQLRLGRAEPDPGITWVCADALALPVPSAVAAAALSTSGLIYVPDPAAAVAEMARVCRPGGAIGMTAWTDDGSMAAFGRLMTAATGDVAPHDPLAVWGRPEHLVARLSAVADDVTVATGALVAHAPTVEQWWEVKERSPAIASVRARLSPDAYDDLAQQLKSAAREHGRLTEEGFSLADDYLVAAGRVR